MGLLDPPSVPRSATTNPGELYGLDSTGTPAGLNHQLAYAEDTTGYNLPMVNGAPVYPLGLVINVPVTKRFVELQGFMPFQVTSAGSGALLVAIYEITSGTATYLDSNGPTGNFLTSTWSQFQAGRVTVELGPVTAERQFALAGLLEVDATLAASIRSQSSGAPRSWIKAVAE